MSPLSLRRHRAERLLREQFESLRGHVLASVRRRLRAGGVRLDEADLEAAYAQAWQGLYAAVLEGEQIISPVAWLSLVTHRRALDEHRARTRAHAVGALALQQLAPAGAARPQGARLAPQARALTRDMSEELDDRVRLRQLFEGLRGRLDSREREAATLCYLQGLSRADAAARMQLSERRMRKLMEGRGPGRPGVAAKVGAIVRTISENGWCEEQGSLMRAFAFGVLDPHGERHRLAAAHSAECPACRAYVASLRGLAAVLPPVLLPGGLAASLLACAGAGARAGVGAGAGGAAATSTSAGTSAGAGAAGAGSGAGAGGAAGVLTASGAAGAGGAAGGGWLLGAGPLGAKLAAGCLLALSLGAGCVLGAHHGVEHKSRPTGHARSRTLAPLAASLASSPAPDDPAATASPSAQADTRAVLRERADQGLPLSPAARASREFGPEQAPAGGQAATARAPVPAASIASRAPAASAGATAGAGTAAEQPASGSVQAPAAGDSVAAEREFTPG